MALTAVIITYNEAKNIARCIESVLNVCNEVIVLDSFSTDETPIICKRYSGVKFEQRKWEGYTKSKNYAHSLAQNSFILSIDADECLSDELILSIKTCMLDEKIAYSMNRLNNYCGTWVKHGGWYPDKKVRIFHKHAAFWDGDYVHETLMLNEGITTSHLQGDLLHYAFEKTEAHLAKIEKYAQLHAAQLKQQGKSFNLLKLTFAPIAKFIRSYFFQMGILDGKAGFDIARYSAYAVYRKYQLLKAE
jgi:glycosyltransferase involved in cell wall biosynthesis